MTYKNQNYAFENPQACENGAVFESCNFSQVKPDTEIFKGKTGLKFVKCNLVNSRPPIGSVEDDCNRTKIDFCSHNHSDLIEKGLSKCGSNCKHIPTARWLAGIFIEKKLIKYTDEVITYVERLE